MDSEHKESLILIDNFIDNIWLEKGLSKNTLSAYNQDLSNFTLWLKGSSLKNVDRIKLLDYLTLGLNRVITVDLQLVPYLV